MTAAQRKIRVMLVDDHEVVRQGVHMLLDATDDLVVVAEASTAEESVVEAGRAKPDVVVMDVRLKQGDGIQATREIRARRPQTKVLMLTSFADDEALYASIIAGASGYVLKQIRGEELMNAIRAVADGVNLLDSTTTKMALERLRKGKHLTEDSRLSRLTAQEERILSLIADGHTNGEIGKQLQLAEKTIKNYVSSILVKLEVARRSEAAAYLAGHSAYSGH